MKITSHRLAAATMLGAALGLGACNDAGGSFPAAAAGAGPFRLPANMPCSAEIDRYQSIVKSDLDTGNLEQKVYDQIEAELSRATSACSAGKDGQSHSIVAASKARHGYGA